jgi:methyl-accepting chemotaxis protein
MVTNWVPRRGPDRDTERRTRQIKEIVRLGTVLRADMSLDDVLRHVVEAINSTLGFRVAVLNLLHADRERVEIVATAGLTQAERERLMKSPPLVSRLLGVLRPEFCISHSYYISHHYKHLFDGVESVTVYTALPPSAQRPPDAWHPEDVLLVPLVSQREDRLLGLLSLDQPEDGKIPSQDTIEIVELFASQAALAIDTSRLFAEREQERQALDTGLFELLFQLEQVRQGFLDVRVQLSAATLSPVADSLNAVLHVLASLLTNVRDAGDVVNARASATRDAASQLAADAQQQAEQIVEVSSAVEGMATNVRAIAEVAHDTSTIAQEAIEISNSGREAAERAVEGMSAVREMALQSVKKIKRLGESAQDIGEIVQMVSDFANQTNLLALNAAIEAARAGDNGRGFAVVAQEIRNLANNSNEAAKQIHARIRGIQNDTSAVVYAIEHSTQQVVVQSELATQAGAALEAVDAETQRIARAIGVMNETAMQQAQAAVRVAQSINDISQITAQTRDSMEQMRDSMDQVAGLARSLLNSISQLRLVNARHPQGPALLAAAPGNSLPSELATQPMPAYNSGPLNTIAAGAGARPAEENPGSAVWKGAVTKALPRTTFPLHPSATPAYPDIRDDSPYWDADSWPLPERGSTSGPLPQRPGSMSGPLDRPGANRGPLGREPGGEMGPGASGSFPGHPQRGMTSGPLSERTPGFSSPPPSPRPSPPPQSLPPLNHLPDEP